MVLATSRGCHPPTTAPGRTSSNLRSRSPPPPRRTARTLDSVPWSRNTRFLAIRGASGGTVGGFRVSDEYVEQHPEADVSATELVINVMYAAELLGREADQVFRPFGLSRGSHNVLQILGGAREPLRPSEVTARLTVTTATVTGLLDTLEA